MFLTLRRKTRDNENLTTPTVATVEMIFPAAARFDADMFGQTDSLLQSWWFFGDPPSDDSQVVQGPGLRQNGGDQPRLHPSCV